MKRAKAKRLLGQLIARRLKNDDLAAKEVGVSTDIIVAIKNGNGLFERKVIIRLIDLAGIREPATEKYIAVIFARHQRMQGGRWKKNTRKRVFAGCRRK